MQSYRHVQYARWLWLLAVAIFGFHVVTTPSEHDPVVYALLAVLVIAAFVFSRLETRVDAAGIHWFFGFGFPGGSIAWHEVTKVETTEIGFLEGWPIHWTFGHGWLWYSGGYHALEFFRARGGPVTVGTDDPQGLFEAVERFRKGAA